MTVRHAILALLAQRPRHGYDLRAAFAAVAGGEENWDVKPAQVYTTLTRLEKSGLVTEQSVEQDAGPEKRIYAITSAGQTTLQDWFAEGTPPEHQRDPFFLKLMLALISGTADPYRLIGTQRTLLYRELHAITNQRSRVDPKQELAKLLLLDKAAMQLEADLRWLDMTEARLDDIRRQPLPEPEARPRGRPEETSDSCPAIKSLDQEETMPLVQTENLTKVYGQGETAVVALDHVTMSVDAGELVAVMGPSGCGKSTLLHLMGGLDRPSEGSVLIDGKSLSSLSDNALAQLRRRKIGFIFQFFNLIPILDAVDNAALPLLLDGKNSAQAKQKATEWLQKVGLGNRLSNRPDELSAGQQQRVAIARALLTDPMLVLADEPTGNLDSRAADEIAGLLHQVAKTWGHAVLMVTHDPRIAAHADRIVFLKDGTIVNETALEDGNAGERELAAEQVRAALQ